jgi:prepilin-type N-terminal cleavage/methylation domain-containing protein
MTYHADHTRHCNRNRNGSRRRRAFTLVEVMISVALVLLLMYGVSQVFKMSGDAVGANQAVSKIIRDHRAAAATMAEDFRNCAADSPLFLISSRIAYTGPAGTAYMDTVDGASVQRGFKAGFPNAEAQRNNSNLDPTYIDNSPTPIPFIQLGGSDRVPRIDRLGFFTRSVYRRQTVPNSATATLATSGEAYVWYGHTAYPGHSAYANGQKFLIPENQYGADRNLGRLAILMKDGSALSGADSPVIGETTASASPPPALWPFGYDGQPAPPNYTYTDLAPITIDQFRQTVDGAYQAPPTAGPYAGPVNWFRPMEDDLSTNRIMRYWCDPTVSRPITPQKLSQTVPYFVGHCTQFIVEYAGDYLKQDETDAAEPGKATDALSKQDLTAPYTVETGETDGQIDYIIDTSTDLDPSGKPYSPVRPAAVAASKWVRRIRWYGLPRDVNGDGKITVNDVVPLADVMDYYNIFHSAHPGQRNFVGATWEHDNDLPKPRLTSGLPSATITYGPWKYDYVTKLANNATAPNFKYTCAWHNDAPPLIRVLVKIDDPTGKLQDGQWYEYIFSR